MKRQYPDSAAHPTSSSIQPIKRSPDSREQLLTNSSQTEHLRHKLSRRKAKYHIVKTYLREKESELCTHQKNSQFLIREKDARIQQQAQQLNELQREILMVQQVNKQKIQNYFHEKNRRKTVELSKEPIETRRELMWYKVQYYGVAKELASDAVSRVTKQQLTDISKQTTKLGHMLKKITLVKQRVQSRMDNQSKIHAEESKRHVEELKKLKAELIRERQMRMEASVAELLANRQITQLNKELSEEKQKSCMCGATQQLLSAELRDAISRCEEATEVETQMIEKNQALESKLKFKSDDVKRVVVELENAKQSIRHLESTERELNGILNNNKAAFLEVKAQVEELKTQLATREQNNKEQNLEVMGQFEVLKTHLATLKEKKPTKDQTTNTESTGSTRTDQATISQLQTQLQAALLLVERYAENFAELERRILRERLLTVS